ncbi:MAG: polysaccharide pyruvyl transferase family protein [Kiritimatiellae bacterium]|nr:polysaccharide pyruvyl transferase family protein [Kiritimatiellia bacterium]
MKIFLDALSRVPTVSIGTQALIIGSLQILRRRFPDATFVMLTSHPGQERHYLDATGIPIEYVPRHPSQWGTLRQFRAIVRGVDAVACAWGDGYVGKPAWRILQKTFPLQQAGIPLVLVTASLGPFRAGLDAWLARRALALFDRLTVRDLNSQRHLRAAGLSDVRCLPDTAFVLEPAPDAAVDEILRREGIPSGESPVGINPSILLHHRFSAVNGRPYPPVVAALIEHVRRATQRPVLLIPHQIYPAGFPGLTPEIRLSWDGDDRAAAELVFQSLASREGVYALAGDYSPAEYKGILKRCELFVGGRMHAVISAVSAGTPSVIMQYSHKASGVMEMLGLSDRVWDIRSPESALSGLVEQAWRDRVELRARLRERSGRDAGEAYGLGDVFAEAMEARRSKA